MGRKNIQMCRNRFHCSECKRGFANEGAKNNHQRWHRERIIAEKRNPKRYGIAGKVENQNSCKEEK